MGNIEDKPEGGGRAPRRKFDLDVDNAAGDVIYG
jgi:hypothetical protein